MNIMSLFEGNWPEVMQSICARRLAAEEVPLREEASLVLYLVSPDYALRKGPQVEFALDGAALEREGCHVFFSSAVQTGQDTYRTVGTSRALALASTAPTLEQARLRVVGCAASVPALQWRGDVGDERYLNGLGRLVTARPSSGGESLLSNAI
jgi:phosphoribosylamine--glycine ligase